MNKTFFDLVNDYVSAEKIDEIVFASEELIEYAKSHLSTEDDILCQIYNNKLYICPKGNASLSTSIISELLGIKANNIDDSRSHEDIYSIHLKRR